MGFKNDKDTQGTDKGQDEGEYRFGKTVINSSGDKKTPKGHNKGYKNNLHDAMKRRLAKIT